VVVRDPYEVLGVSPHASDEEVRAAYRDLTRRWHPDRFVGAGQEEHQAAAERMAEITGAFHLLQDPMALARFRGAQHRAAQATPGAADSPQPPPSPSTPPPQPPPAPRPPPDFDYREAAGAEFFHQPPRPAGGPTDAPGRPAQGVDGAADVARPRHRKRGVRPWLGAILLGVAVGALVVSAHAQSRSGGDGRVAGAWAGPIGGLGVGDCFDLLVSRLDGALVTTAVVNPCAVPHELEAVGLVDLDGAFASHPGEPAIGAFARPRCDRALAAPGTSPRVPLTLHVLSPSEGTWAGGARHAVCAVGAADGARLTGRARVTLDP
jgi:hypothetical protein